MCEGLGGAPSLCLLLLLFGIIIFAQPVRAPEP